MIFLPTLVVPLLAVALVALPLGLLIRLALRAVYGARGPSPDDPAYLVFNLLSWSLLVGGVVFLSAGSLLFASVLLTVVLASLLEYVLARRAMQRDAAWSIVTRSAASGKNVPLALELQRDRFDGIVRRDLGGFVWHLNAGESLPTALGIWHKGFPREAQGYAALGKANGTLPCERRPTPLDLGSLASGQVAQFGYLSWVVITAVLLAIAVFIYIVPAFEKIFLDFQIDLPHVSSSLIETATFLSATNLIHFAAMLFAMLVLGLLVVALLYLFDIPVLRWAIDRLSTNRHRALLMRLIAVTIEEDMPITQTLRNLALGSPCFPAAHVAARMRKALRRLTTGADWKEALSWARLLKPEESALLETAQKAQNLPWALRALADRLEARSQYRWNLVSQYVYPVALLIVAAPVLWFCVAMFLPLVELIGGLL